MQICFLKFWWNSIMKPFPFLKECAFMFPSKLSMYDTRTAKDGATRRQGSCFWEDFQLGYFCSLWDLKSRLIKLNTKNCFDKMLKQYRMQRSSSINRDAGGKFGLFFPRHYEHQWKMPQPSQSRRKPLRPWQAWGYDWLPLFGHCLQLRAIFVSLACWACGLHMAAAFLSLVWKCWASSPPKMHFIWRCDFFFPSGGELFRMSCLQGVHTSGCSGSSSAPACRMNSWPTLRYQFCHQNLAHYTFDIWYTSRCHVLNFAFWYAKKRFTLCCSVSTSVTIHCPLALLSAAVPRPAAAAGTKAPSNPRGRGAGAC